MKHADLLEELRRRFTIKGNKLVVASPTRKSKVGMLAGYRHGRGYRMCSFTWNGKERYILAHRIVWMLDRGRWLSSRFSVDHIDGNRRNNNPSNLRAVHPATNAKNQTIAQTRSKSGVLGVVWAPDKQMWRAQHRLNGKLLNIGHFSDVVDAANSYWDSRVASVTTAKMTKALNKKRRKQLRLARSLFEYGCGPDGATACKSKHSPVVSAAKLLTLDINNSTRMEKAARSRSLYHVCRLRFIRRGNDILWKSASGKNARAGCVAGNKRSDGRTMLEFFFDGKQVQYSSAAISWMLANRESLPSRYKIKHIDGNKSNIDPANIKICVIE